MARFYASEESIPNGRIGNCFDFLAKRHGGTDSRESDSGIGHYWFADAGTVSETPVSNSTFHDPSD